MTFKQNFHTRSKSSRGSSDTGRSRVKALLTGATGFIGTALVAPLLERGEAIHALVRPETARNPRKMAHLSDRSRVTIFIGKLDDPALVRRAVRGVDTVYHLAFLYGQAWLPQDFLTPNLRATEILLRASVEAGIRRFVLSGSVSVYGWRRAAWHWPVAEDAPLDGYGNYADTKILTEGLVRRFTDTHGLEHAIVRLPHVYGRGAATFEYFLSGLLPPALLARRPETVIDPTLLAGRAWHLVHVRDAVDGVLRAATRPEGRNDTFNIAGLSATTRSQLVAIVDGLVEAHSWGGRPARPHATFETIGFQIFDTSKAARRLRFAPKVSVSTGVAEVVHGLLEPQRRHCGSGRR